MSTDQRPGSKRISDHIRANVIGYVALFLALGGTAWATHIGPNDIADNAVLSRHIKPQAVRDSEIQSNTVGDSELESNAVGSDELQFNSVGTVAIASGAVQNPELATAAVAEHNLALGAVTSSRLRDGASITELFDDDGPGSGLNADLLDGQSSGAFAPSDHNHDSRYFTQTQLQTSDGSAPNAGVNRMHWNNLTGVPASFADGSDDGGASSDVSCAGCVDTADIDDLAVTIPKLAFDPATQAELDSHETSADHDGRYFTETELSTSDGNAPNTGSNRVNWNNLTNVPAGFVDGSDDGGGWSLTGNAGTNPSTDFLGTTDTVAFNIRVNNARALRLEPALNGAAPGPNLIGGSPDNTVTGGVHSATIAGGGRGNPADAATANRVTDSGGVVGGGTNNQAGDGAGTTSDRSLATVGGGNSNTASGNQATVGGGIGNTAGALQAIVGGGALNVASGQGAAVVGGSSNSATALQAFVGGGALNLASNASATVGGGASNTASAIQSTVAGGDSNTATAQNATVGGGFSNDATATQATVAGGNANLASGVDAAVPGGELNTAAGDFSFAAGRRAKNTNAGHDGVFMWADSQNADIASTAANQFVGRAQNGFFLTSNSTVPEDQGLINTSAGAQADGTNGAFLSDGGAWTSVSDENVKAGFGQVSPSEILAGVANLPVRTWHYRSEPDVTHIGPVAQDFYRAFGVGPDRQHIASVDADGVALAAIKGLHEENEVLREEIVALKEEVASPASGAGSALPPAALAAVLVPLLALAAGFGVAAALGRSGAAGRLAASRG
jgi:hypothetical protein